MSATSASNPTARDRAAKKEVADDDTAGFGPSRQHRAPVKWKTDFDSPPRPRPPLIIHKFFPDDEKEKSLCRYDNFFKKLPDQIKTPTFDTIPRSAHIVLHEMIVRRATSALFFLDIIPPNHHSSMAPSSPRRQVMRKQGGCVSTSNIDDNDGNPVTFLFFQPLIRLARHLS